MKVCIYCKMQKAEGEFSLEHIIPQFLGGAFVSDRFKTRDVCGKCNNDLGLFVDGGFEKNFLVWNLLRTMEGSICLESEVNNRPLLCIGRSGLRLPQQDEEHVCEAWIGPFGERAFWVRPADKRTSSYVGGNPITTKNSASRAYYLLSERSIISRTVSLGAFRSAFERRKVKKILCNLEGCRYSAKLGFDEPDSIDEERGAFLREYCRGAREAQYSFVVDSVSEYRFLVKLAIGVAYALLGPKSLKSEYSAELNKGLYYRAGEAVPRLDVFYGGFSSGIQSESSESVGLNGVPGAVTLIIRLNDAGVVVELIIDNRFRRGIMCATRSGLSETDLEALRDGVVVVLFRKLGRAFEMSLPAYVAHELGVRPHPGLAEIAERRASTLVAIRSLAQSAANVSGIPAGVDSALLPSDGAPE